MKPRNFPSRVKRRQNRANARRQGKPYAYPPERPHVRDTTFRIGAAARRA